jgi:hypothetical protein
MLGALMTRSPDVTVMAAADIPPVKPVMVKVMLFPEADKLLSNTVEPVPAPPRVTAAISWNPKLAPLRSAVPLPVSTIKVVNPESLLAVPSIVILSVTFKLKVEAADEPTASVPEDALTLIVWVFCPEIVAAIAPLPATVIVDAPEALIVEASFDVESTVMPRS